MMKRNIFALSAAMLLLTGCGEASKPAAEPVSSAADTSAAETTTAPETTAPAADSEAESGEISAEVAAQMETYTIGDTGISLMLPKDWDIRGFYLKDGGDWSSRFGQDMLPIVAVAGEDNTLKMPKDRVRYHALPPEGSEAGENRLHDDIVIRVDKTRAEMDLAAYAEGRVPGGDIGEPEEVVLETEDGREFPGVMLGYAGQVPTFPDSAVYGVCLWCDLEEKGCSLFVCVQYDSEKYEPLLDVVMDSIAVE